MKLVPFIQPYPKVVAHKIIDDPNTATRVIDEIIKRANLTLDTLYDGKPVYKIMFTIFSQN